MQLLKKFLDALEQNQILHVSFLIQSLHCDIETINLSLLPLVPFATIFETAAETFKKFETYERVIGKIDQFGSFWPVLLYLYW